MLESYVSSNSTCIDECRIVVFFIAGILTYRNNFEAAAKEIAARYSNVKIVMIFPYGIAKGTNRSSLIPLLAKQLPQVGFDLVHTQSRRVNSVSQIIREHGASAERLLLIGHSAGGVVAYRAGLYLEERYDMRQIQALAVGSPKFRLKDVAFNTRFTYITGQNPDKITRVGRWNKPGSSKFRGKPGNEIQLEFNPRHQGWRYHASYFLNSAWHDANQAFHSNVQDLIATIYELFPECKKDARDSQN